MKNLRFSFFLLLFALHPVLFAQQAGWNHSFLLRMDTVLNDELTQRTRCSLQILDLQTDSVLFQQGELQQMRPASVMKTLTCATALEQLGPDYCYTTKLYHTGKLHRHTLKGDLYIKGGYDPRFSAADMTAFIHALQDKGIRKIKGHIFTDVSLKDTLPKGEGWCWDDPDMKTTPLLYDADSTFMPHFFASLDTAGIKHRGSSVDALLPSDGLQLLCSRSHSLDDILVHMLKVSDNTYAESLFYQIGAQSGKPYAKASDAVSFIKKFIEEKLQLDTKNINIADGSGLSLYNYLTPQLIVRLLRYVYHQPVLYSHLYPALPVAGLDGTLVHRMQSGTARLNVHAKTGSETGVCSLAGFCTAGNGHPVCFAIFNAGQLHTKEACDWQDRIMQALTQP